MRSQLDAMLYGLILALTSLRSPESDSKAVVWSTYGRARGFIDLAASLDLITHEQWLLLGELVSSAHDYSGKPYPDKRNLGPVMPFVVECVRARDSRVKPAAQVPANDEQVSAPAPRRELRLLCLLVSSRTDGTRSFPVHTLRPMPPRVSYQGQWFLEGEPCLSLRETHATAPAPEVLARYLRLGQSGALRADPRAVRAGGLSA